MQIVAKNVAKWTSKARPRVSISYDKERQRQLLGEAARMGARRQTRLIEEHYQEISPFVAKVVVRNNMQYQLLRNAMASDRTTSSSRREKLRGVGGVSFPQFPPIEVVNRRINHPDALGFTIRRAMNVWELPGQDLQSPLTSRQWCRQELQPAQGVFKGKMFTLCECMDHLGAIPIPKNNEETRPTLHLYIWADGGRIDQCKIIGIIKVIDQGLAVLESCSSRPIVWFHCIGRESALSQLSELRCSQILEVESTDWILNGKRFHLDFRYVGGDNSCLWKEAGLSGSNTPWRCVHCTMAVTDRGWNEFDPSPLRRSLATQMQDSMQGIHGVTRRPLLAWNDLLLGGNREIIFVPAVMHNLRAVLRVCRSLEDRYIPPKYT